VNKVVAKSQPPSAAQSVLQCSFFQISLFRVPFKPVLRSTSIPRKAGNGPFRTSLAHFAQRHPGMRQSWCEYGNTANHGMKSD
jgi:hypothetical protein